MMPLLGKASLKPHVERAHRAARFWGEMSLIRHSANSFFVLSVGCGKVGLYIFPFSQSGSSIGLSICPSVDVSQSILKFVPCSQKPRCRNSPGSCCPQESRWCCCWGWTTRLVLLSYGEPLRSLTWSRQVRKRDPGLLKWWSKSTDKTSCKVRWDWLKPTWALGESGVSCGTKSLPFNHAAQGLWTLNSALSRSSIVRWERSNKWDSSSEGREES